MCCALVALCPAAGLAQKQVTYIQVVEKATPSITLTASSSSIAAGASVTFTVQMGGRGAPPSGSVMFMDGTTELGAGTLTGGGAATFSSSGMAAGIHQVVAQYTGDGNYNSVASQPATVTVAAPTQPLVSFSASSTTVTTGQALTVTVSVSGGTGKPAPTGTLQVACGSYSSAVETLVAGSATFSIPAGALPVGNDTLTATYAPDAASALLYSAATFSIPVTVTGTSTGGTAGFTLSGSSVTIAAGATTGNVSTITVTPQGGFTGSVALTAALNGISPGVVSIPTFSFGTTTPVTITGTSPGQAALTFYTVAASSSSGILAQKRGGDGLWHAAGGVLAGCVLLLSHPAKRRRWQSMLGMVLLLAVLAGGATACISSKPHTTPGTYAIAVTGKSGAMTATCNVTLTVQ